MSAIQYAKDQPPGFTNLIERVAVVGASGRAGSHVTQALLATGKHTITAITRPDSSHTYPEGVKVVRVDYYNEDETELVDSLRGQQALVVALSAYAPQDTMSKLCRAAAEAGVSYIQPNWWGVDPNNEGFCKDIGLLERRDALVKSITDLGVSKYLLLASGFWYEFSLGGGPNRYGFDFAKKELVLFDQGDVKRNTTTLSLTGKAIAGLLSLNELPIDENDTTPNLAQYANSAVYVNSFYLTQKDMFESVKRVTNSTDADWKITHESSAARVTDAGNALKRGDFGEFTKLLYGRSWVPEIVTDYKTLPKNLNEVLQLSLEDLDEATKKGIQMGLSGEVPFSH